LIFTYMGPPEKMSLLPNYEVLARQDGTRWCSYYPIRGGYLQHLEGAVDTTHAEYLHQNNWTRMKHEIAQMPKPRIDYTETEYGIRQHGEKPHPNGEVGPIYTYFFMPGGFIRLGGSYVGDHDVEIQKFQSWYTPVDDGHTLRFQVAFQPLDAEGKPFQWRPDGRLVQPGFDEDYGRDYDGNDTITGITPTTPGTFRAQDTMANETQGLPFLDRSLEHLGAHDRVLMAMRLMIAKGISDVEKGLDPKHVIRDPAQNEMVYVRGPEPLEHFLAERQALAAAPHS
jgi:5,5'-dehydrodivanillate O-demethylase oxygenase subunit